MKMLQSSAQTLPLWVGKMGEKAPPLCGAVPAEPTYGAKVDHANKNIQCIAHMVFVTWLKCGKVKVKMKV
jgi:methyl coenzyme M reductase subunit D